MKLKLGQSHHTCVDCKESEPIAEYYRYRHQGLFSRCKQCQTAYSMKWAKMNPERVAASKEKHRTAIRTRGREYAKRWREANPLRKKQYEMAIKLEVMRHYCGGEPHCQCCGELNLKFLTLDHANNDGAVHRREMVRGRGSMNIYLWLRRNNFPAGFQILCWNCNCGKHHNPGKVRVCPHTEEPQFDILGIAC